LGLAAFVALGAVPVGASAGGTGPPASQPSLNTGPVLDQKLTVGDITISYPTGSEAQAKDLMAVCQRVILPRRARLLAVPQAFSDRKATAERVADLLGCPDHSASAYDFLSAFASAVDALTENLFLPMLSDIRVYREADLKASGGLHSGVIDLSHDSTTDRFMLQINSWVTSEGVKAPSGRGFLPVVVRDDGTFRTPPDVGLAEWVAEPLDELVVASAVTLRAAVIHETAEVLLVRVGCDHPFARWFNEGVANWAELQVVAEVAPEYLQLCREHLLPRQEADPMRERTNLLAWTQATYQREFVLAGDAGLDEASYRYATELIDRLLHGQPRGTLAKVVGKLKESQSPDTDAICQAWQDVTGQDAKSMLLEYVPAKVRDGLAQGLTTVRLQEGYEALSAGRLPQAAALLKEALDMNPSDPDAHLNLAIIMRRALRRPQAPTPGTEQRRRLESQRHIAIAVALTKRDPSHQFQVHGPVDDEARYALGRAEQFRGRLTEANDILSKLPRDHADAQEALKEIAEEEKARAPQPPGAVNGRPEREQR